MQPKVFASPGRFVVGKDELTRMAEYVKSFGAAAALIAHEEDAARVADSLVHLRKSDIRLVQPGFSGECTHAEIDRCKKIVGDQSVDVVIGLGGGKAIDTAKCVAHFTGLPLIVAPTIASTDAPCSTLGVVYNEEHVFVHCYLLPKNPDIVLVDSQIIANAPPRFLAAGIADAYATYFEARACVASDAHNFVGGCGTRAAFALSELCLKILIEDGEKAMAACRDKVVTKALENIIEANLLLSGLGFESVGLAAAHGLHDALTILPETHRAMHGEKVAIGLLAQHALENESAEQIAGTVDFFRKIGIPTCLADIGIVEGVNEKLRAVAREATKEPGLHIFNMPFEVDEDMVFAALKSVDALGSLKEQT